MGLRDLFQKLFNNSDATSRNGDVAATPTPTPAPAPPPPPDPVAPLLALAPHEAVPRALEALALETSPIAAAALLRWVRKTALEVTLPTALRLELADYFSRRGEPSVGESLLRAVAASDPAEAPPAWMRLGDLASQSGDTVGASQCYESVLAIDLEYPGARERLARLKEPVRAGAAGATLLAPDASVGLGRFELQRELGRGGAGAVFLARDKALERAVALKLYHPQARADRNARLRGEAQVAASLASPFVVRVYDLFEDYGALAMEYASDTSLRAKLARQEAPPGQVHRWLKEVAAGLAHVHARGWVHRDLKPGNVLLRGDGCAVLTDFGLARRIGAQSPAMEGTPGYLAPEGRGGAPADPRMDVYAFGALAKELSGDRDPALARLITEALSEDPSARPQDGEALLARWSRLVG